MTVAVLAHYLPDYKAALERDHIARWQGGALDANVESEAKGRCNTIDELAGLRFEHVLQFYGQPEPPDETAEQSESGEQPPTVSE